MRKILKPFYGRILKFTNERNNRNQNASQKLFAPIDLRNNGDADTLSSQIEQNDQMELQVVARGRRGRYIRNR